MTDLSSLQRDFQNHLLTGQKAIEQAIISTKKVSAETRLSIYHHAYHARLEEALTTNFPCLQSYLGDEAFHQLSMAYIASHPSNNRSIRWYGDKLPAYLIDYFQPAYHYLSELAQFEWTMTLAFDAADAPVFQLTQMAAIPAESWAGMSLKPHPSLYRMNFLWDSVELWEALAHEQVLEQVVKNTNPVPWVLWRHDYINRFYPLLEDESWAMDAILKGLSFGEICEGLCQWHTEEAVGQRAASLLKGWIQSGLISDIITR